MSLFFAPQTVQGRPVLVQFRAGLMNIANGTATADNAKGYVSLIQTTSGLLEMWWQPTDGTASTTQSKSIAFPFGDATFEKVEKCKTGTVFALCLSGSKDPQQTTLFWLQEPNASAKEADIVTKVKKLVGDSECRKRLQAATGGATNTSAARAPAASGSASSAAAAAAPATNAAAKTSSPITNEALQAILQNLTRSRPVDVSLQQMLGSDEMLSALREDPEYYLSRVGEHLPPGHSSDIVAEIRNPQASAAAATLQAAVSESPNTLNEVLTAFGLPKPSTSAAAASSSSSPVGSSAHPSTIAVPSATALCEAIIRDHENKKSSPATDCDNANEAK